MKAYQCSKCAKLGDYDEYCQCDAGIDVRLGYRDKGDIDICKKNFELLDEEKIWHEKFRWEK